MNAALDVILSANDQAGFNPYTLKRQDQFKFKIEEQSDESPPIEESIKCSLETSMLEPSEEKL